MHKFIGILLMALSLHFHGQSQTYTLQQCIDRALAENLQLKQARNSNQFNQISARQARANQYPSLNAFGNQQFSFGRSIDPFTNQYIEQNIASNNFSLNSNLLVFQGFQNRNFIRQHELAAEAGNFDIQRFEQDIMLAVVAAYMQVVFSHDHVEIAMAQLEVTREVVERAKRLVDAGSIPEVSLLQIEAQSAAETAALVLAQNSLQLARINLMQLMELPVSDDFEVVQPKLPEPGELPGIPPTPGIFEEALHNQPQIAGTELWMQSAKAGIEVAQGTRYPRLSIGGSILTGYSNARNRLFIDQSVEERQIGYLRSDPSEAVMSQVPMTTTRTEAYPFSQQVWDNLSQAASINLSIPIFNNRMALSNLERARINHQQAEISHQQARNELRKNIEQAHADYVAAVARYEANLQQARAYRESFAGTQLRFNLGLVNAVDYSTEKNILTRAEIEATQALYQLAFSRNILNFYRGLPFDL